MKLYKLIKMDRFFDGKLWKYLKCTKMGRDVAYDIAKLILGHDKITFIDDNNNVTHDHGHLFDKLTDKQKDIFFEINKKKTKRVHRGITFRYTGSSAAYVSSSTIDDMFNNINEQTILVSARIYNDALSYGINIDYETDQLNSLYSYIENTINITLSDIYESSISEYLAGIQYMIYTALDSFKSAKGPSDIKTILVMMNESLEISNSSLDDAINEYISGGGEVESSE